MDVFSFLWIILLIFVAMSLTKILSHMLKFLFYTLLAVFVIVFVFGISLNGVLKVISELILLVF